MRETLILKAGTAPPEGCTPSTGAPAGYEAWTREVEDTEWHAAPKRAPGKPRTILDAVEMILSGLESEISDQTPAMPLPFSVDAPEIQTTAQSLATMPPLSPALIRQIFAALRSAGVADPRAQEEPTALDALAAEDRRRVLLHLTRLLGATITVDGQKQQPDPLADGLAILAMIAAPAVQGSEQILAERLTAAIVERDALRYALDDRRADGKIYRGKDPLPNPPKAPDSRKIGSLHIAEQEMHDKWAQRYEEDLLRYTVERNATLLRWANRLAPIVGKIEQIRHQQRTTSPISWALDLAIQIGVVDPATGAPIGTLRTVQLDDGALLDALAAAVVPDTSRDTDRTARSVLRETLEAQREDLLSLLGEDFAPYRAGDLIDLNLRKRIDRSLDALTATPEAPGDAERLRWYRARCARLGALLWPPPSPHEIQAEMAAAKARLTRHAPKAAILVAVPERSDEREGEPLEPERLGEDDATVLAILLEMNY